MIDGERQRQDHSIINLQHTTHFISVLTPPHVLLGPFLLRSSCHYAPQGPNDVRSEGSEEGTDRMTRGERARRAWNGRELTGRDRGRRPGDDDGKRATVPLTTQLVGSSLTSSLRSFGSLDERE